MPVPREGPPPECQTQADVLRWLTKHLTALEREYLLHFVESFGRKRSNAAMLQLAWEMRTGCTAAPDQA